MTYTKVNRSLAEGRAALLRRHAELEAGSACLAVGPRLSAWLDGEVAGAERRQLRAHLRSCGGCRAELRALADAGRGLSVVLPGGLLASGAAAGGHDHVPAFLVRAYEALAGTVHERAVAVAQVAEAASGAKLAAAVSAAALAAGGGAVAVHEHGFTRPAESPRRSEARAAPRRAPASAPALAAAPARPELRATAVGLRTAAGANVAGTSASSSATSTTATRTARRRRTSPARREFGSGGSTTTTASAAGAGTAVGVVAQREFTPEPSPAPVTASPAPAAAPPATGGTSTAGSAAASSSPAQAEFGGP